MITSSQIASITDASTDLIGTSALLYYGHPYLPAGTVASRENELDRAFRRLAEALGYRVEKFDASKPSAEELEAYCSSLAVAAE